MKNNFIRNNFSVGERVIVYKNSERIPKAARIGKVGIITGLCATDCWIQFDDGELACICSKDIVRVDS